MIRGIGHEVLPNLNPYIFSGVTSMRRKLVLLVYVFPYGEFAGGDVDYSIRYYRNRLSNGIDTGLS